MSAHEFPQSIAGGASDQPATQPIDISAILEQVARP